jgi:hypothetical protein
MPVEAYEDSCDIFIELLDALTLQPGEVFPKLVMRGEQETRRFRTLVLENEYLRLTFVPALGGRLWSIFDKRSQKEIQEGQSMIEGGSRGVELTRGFMMALGTGHRPNTLGNVDSMILPAEDEEESASILISEVHSGMPLAHTCKYSLAPGLAIIDVEVTVQNRSLQPAPYELSRFWMGQESGALSAPGVVISESEALLFEPGTFIDYQNGLIRRPVGSWLGGRQVDQFGFSIVPLGGELEQVDWAARAGVGCLRATDFAFHATQPMLGHRMLVQNADGETFEAPVDLYPERAYVADLSSIPGKAVAVQLKNAEKHVVATITRASGPSEWEKPLASASLSGATTFDAASEAQLLNATADPLLRLGAYLRLAAMATKRGDHRRADACYEQALLVNGDDPLLWWAKAVNKRLGGLDGEERTELLNAHFLAPLEPCLRAEAFLSQPQTHGKEPSPLLVPLTENPESFVEVACRLVEAGMTVEAGRFIDEAVRHVDLAMLHYLAGFLYLTESKMEVQAAEHVAKGNRGQWPPCPYRAPEIDALNALTRRFPQDAILRERSMGFIA